MDDPFIPRCGHGNIILGCPEDPCDEQTTYLIEQATLLARYYEAQVRAARQLVRPWAVDWPIDA